jgi:translation initiation factor 1
MNTNNNNNNSTSNSNSKMSSSATSNLIFPSQPQDLLREAGMMISSQGQIKSGKDGKVHIRVQQRTARKYITSIQGLADDLDENKIAKAIRNQLNCRGSVLNDEKFGQIIAFSGDKRQQVRQFLIDNDICYEDQIVVHGF